MTRNEFIAELETLVEVDAGTMTEETLLGDLERWDSLAVVGFIALVDENMGFTPSPKEISESKNVADLLKIVASGIEG